jgi:hypothetical protein
MATNKNPTRKFVVDTATFSASYCEAFKEAMAAHFRFYAALEALEFFSFLTILSIALAFFGSAKSFRESSSS